MFLNPFPQPDRDPYFLLRVDSPDPGYSPDHYGPADPRDPPDPYFSPRPPVPNDPRRQPGPHYRQPIAHYRPNGPTRFHPVRPDPFYQPDPQQSRGFENPRRAEQQLTKVEVLDLDEGTLAFSFVFSFSCEIF